MHWTYDGEADALYIYLAERPPVSQHEMADGTTVDLDSEGVPVGVEVLGATRGWDYAAVIDRFQIAEVEALIDVAFLFAHPTAAPPAGARKPTFPAGAIHAESGNEELRAFHSAA
jgi:uncharacterized protein YuzE